MIKQILQTILLLSLSTAVLAQWQCCASHQGVCGDQCCDKTPLSEAQCGDFIVTDDPRLAPITTDDALEPLQANRIDESAVGELFYAWYDDYQRVWHYTLDPPHWYRSSSHDAGQYPRVVVYDARQRLIDDTLQQTNQVLAEQLRGQALQQQQQRQQAQQEQQQQIAEQQKALEQQQQLQRLAAEQKVTVGMTMEMVEEAWGLPVSQEIRLEEDEQEVTWDYTGDQSVTFRNNTVISLRTNIPQNP